MKKVVTSALALVACLTLPTSAAAQNTVKLLDPVNIAASTISGQVPPEEAVEFATKQLYLACDAGATASVIGPLEGYSLIVDDFIRVLGPTSASTDYCANFGCFTLPNGPDPLLNVGQPAETYYGAVPPVDVSTSLVQGLGLYTFSLMDVAYSYASSELSLVTTCAIKDKVCHYDSGKKAYKTLTVGAAAIPAHLTKHAGDFLGACEER